MYAKASRLISGNGAVVLLDRLGNSLCSLSKIESAGWQSVFPGVKHRVFQVAELMVRLIP
jgi:hypothetical protein